MRAILQGIVESDNVLFKPIKFDVWALRSVQSNTAGYTKDSENTIIIVTSNTGSSTPNKFAILHYNNATRQVTIDPKSPNPDMVTLTDNGDWVSLTVNGTQYGCFVVFKE
ncbi:hypothetical protein [Butyricicoccus sp. Marseille-Q5471]|uniref:hypothetical protein n=1 Tax=Butyricicoccus sp. Marseille-Q5471 TaxID=3039493 RepID=UPI0024BC3CA8|nr:hypothetical protein [Butyricicoccus sp. Marseille-Q5471]